MQIVFKIQAAKAAQETYKKTEHSVRSELLAKIASNIQSLKSQLAEDIARDEKLPLDWTRIELIEAVERKIVSIAKELNEYSESQLPIGVVGARLSDEFLWSEIILLSALNLAAGNGVIIVVPHLEAISVQWALKILQQSGAPENLVLLLQDTDGQSSKLLAAHPGISAFLCRGLDKENEKLIQTAFQKKKKTQYFGGSKNSCLIHPDYDFESNFDKIMTPFLVGGGQLSVNCHRLFITQSVEKKFYDLLVSYFEKQKNEIELRQPSNKQIWESYLSQISQDSGKILWGGKSTAELKVQATWTRDLSNCSVMQQESLAAPLFIITAVKYVHEMIKWSNTGEYGHSAVIFGPEDKAKNLGRNLVVGHVHLNKWTGFFDMGTPVKGSFLGIPDQRWFGSFFSDVKKMS